MGIEGSRSSGKAVEEAASIMTAFAERTGLSSSQPPQRYLWTDAFAVCNFLALGRITGEARYTGLALRLVDQVHHVLGRYRADDTRKGWLSGLAGSDAEAHPTQGGLRIGKKLPERRPGERFDERLEWDRDGQYFHYLSKWMHALDQVARATGEARYSAWACELAETAHRAFAQGPGGRGGRAMAWKMSSDLSRPLVPSMGQHDPLDGYITCVQLAVTAAKFAPAARTSLDAAAIDFASMLEGRDLRTSDPLGLGGLMTDAYRVEQLARQGASVFARLLDALVAATLGGLSHYASQDELRQPAHRRLAFREIGLAIGLEAVELMQADMARAAAAALRAGATDAGVTALQRYLPMGAAIRTFWMDPASQASPTWTEHRDINEVMLATSLVPQGFVVLSALT